MVPFPHRKKRKYQWEEKLQRMKLLTEEDRKVGDREEEGEGTKEKCSKKHVTHQINNVQKKEMKRENSEHK